MEQLKQKMNKEKAEKEAGELRQQKLKEKAREAVLAHAEELKNMPTLREQQDSRNEQRTKVTSPKMVPSEMKPYDERAF